MSNYEVVKETESKFIEIAELNMQNKLSRSQHLVGLQIQVDLKWNRNDKSECISVSDDGKTAYFFDNPHTISRGTAAIRGDQPVGEGIFYFEMKTNEPLYGTAVMLGFATTHTQLHFENFAYVNLIGIDSHSWGLCHKGLIWHNGKSHTYTNPIFDKNIHLGALINTYQQTIRFYLNGVDLGLAFSNVDVPGKNIYPIISSTATDIELELVDSFKIIYSLQDLCFQKISQVVNKNSKNGVNYDLLPLAKRIVNHLKFFY